MKHPATRELFAYWNEIRKTRVAPERSAVDPAAIRGILADTFMLDVDMDNRFPLRLAGTRVNGLFDADLKGRSFLDLWCQEERRNVAALLMTVADGACPVVAGAAACPNGEEYKAEILFLPLRHRGRTHSRMLGLIKLAREPSWYGMMSIGPLTLKTMRIIGPDEVGRLQTRASAPGSSPRTAAIGTPPPRNHLRLIKGGRAG